MTSEKRIPATKQSLNAEQKKMWHIYKIMEKINSSNDINIVARDIVDMMTSALDCIGGALFIMDEEKGILRPFTYSRIGVFIEKVIPLLPKPFQDHIFDLKKHNNYTVRTVTEKRMFIGRKYRDFMTPVLSSFISTIIQKVIGMKSIVSSPTIAMGKVVGVFQIAFREEEISEEKKKLMKLFSDQCAVAINNAQEYKKLQLQYKQMQEVMAQQSDFIAVTAHELRTPLSIAIFQLDDLLTSSDLSEKQQKELKTVENSLENLKELTEKLFAVQQYDLKKVQHHLAKVEITEFLSEIYKEFLPMMKVKNQTFTFVNHSQEKLLTKIDQVQLRQVLHNILKNANKFTPEKGKIILSLKSSLKGVIICVEDNGPGIPDNLKKSIFEKFRTKTLGAGIGLGLYLCKKIIQLNKGRIWVEDSRKKGACFCIELPLSSK